MLFKSRVGPIGGQLVPKERLLFFNFGLGMVCSMRLAWELVQYFLGYGY